MTGSGTGGSTALERDGVLRAGGVEGAGSGPALLHIQGLSKTFGGTRALIDVDLDVRDTRSTRLWARTARASPR